MDYSPSAWLSVIRPIPGGNNSACIVDMLAKSASRPEASNEVRRGTFPLAVIIITKDEEQNILDCLMSVSWAEDIVVVDAESSDRTVEIARTITPKVFVRKWEGYSRAREYALAQTRCDWVLWLDADERVPPALAEEIRAVVNDASHGYDGFEVARRAFFLGKWIKHCGWYPGYVTRLFRKTSARYTLSRVHEKLEVSGSVGRLKNDLVHYTDETLDHYFSKFNRYTTLAAEDRSEEGGKASLYDILVRPPYLFLKMYVLRRGFMDGIHGLVLSLLSAAYVFVKYAKVLETQYRSESVRDS